jgi:hypothetical protein
MPLHRVTPILAALPLFVAALNLLRVVVEKKLGRGPAAPAAARAGE